MPRKLLTAKTFDYTGFEGEVKGKLICLSGEINTAKGSHIKAALVMGEAISTANDLLAEHGRYGRFAEWVEMECGITSRTALNYMWAWNRFRKCESLAQFDDVAMYALASPKVPEAAAKEAEKLASKGVRITIVRAKEIVDSYRPKPAPQKDRDSEIISESNAPISGNSDNAKPKEGANEALGKAANPLADVDFNTTEIEAAPHPTVDIPALAAPYREAVRALGKIRKDFSELSAEERTGVHLGSSIARILFSIKELTATISQSEPVCVCQKCDGGGCNTCHRSGFWTRTIQTSRS